VNVITGANAQGKTTLLEAVYLLTGVRSFRTFYDRELIAFDKDAARITGGVNAAGREQKIQLDLARGRSRQIRQNGVKRTQGELRETLKAVLFSPDDLQMIRGGAAARRKMMDAAISQLRPGYASLLGDFNRIYENKTRILKDWREKPSLLDTLEDFSRELCSCSARLVRYRAAFARRLHEAAAPVQREFSAGGEELTIDYATVSTVTDPAASEKEIFAQIWERQSQLRQAELDAQQCLVGAHKDDLKIAINGADARSYASQGQTRTAALSIKLAAFDQLEAAQGEPPLLLLDDVLSELDPDRRRRLISRIGRAQALLTCTDRTDFVGARPACVLQVKNGEITEG
jgi:DNA replication and repair protein RecF